MKRIFIGAIMALGVPFFTFAQTAEEAILISNTSIGGTARGLAVGGAFGSLGADFTSISINPAGLGLYRKGELTFTPSLLQTEVESGYLGNKLNQAKYSINLNNAGLVFSSVKKDKHRKPTEKGWVATNFALGMNRIANFNKQSYFASFNPDNSILDHYAQSLNGTHPNSLDFSNGFGPMLAYQTFLLNPTFSDSSQYDPVVSGNVYQEGTVTTSGGIDELTMGIAGNYNNRIFFGGSVGVPLYHRFSDVSFKETQTIDSLNEFDALEIVDDLNSHGAGINAKVGLIFRLGDWVRLGGAVHSPTYYYIEDRYSSSVHADFDTISYKAESPRGKFNYHLTTPWKVVGSASLIMKKFGFLSFDYELLDYSKTYYTFDAPFQLTASETNQEVQSIGRMTSNLRFGAEIAWEVLRFRAGYNIYGSPYKSGQIPGSGDGNKKSYSGGFGIRDKRASLDLTFVRTESFEVYEPYPLENETAEFADNKVVVNQFLVTAGMRF